MPTATAARASGAMNSGCPLDAAPAPPGNCTECVASNTTGQPPSRIIFNPRISTTRLLYPKLDPRSVSTTWLLPVDATFSAARWISCGATNCPFLMFTMRPVRPAAVSRSVCRQRNAGICRMSATSAAGAACHASGSSVRIGKPSDFGPAAFNPARMRSPSFNPGPRYAPTLVRLALSKLALNTNSPTAARMPRAMRCTCSSLSMTHGPAISTRRLPKSANSIGTGELGMGEQRLLNGRLAPVALLFCRADEALEQRVRLHGLALELGMELAAQIPRMVGELADFDVRIVRRLARDLQARRLQALFVFAIELVAVAMALVDFARAVGVVSDAALGQAASPASQPHGAAQLVDPLEFAEFEDDAVRRARVELGGIGGFEAAHIAREFDHQGLHAQADPEVRHLALAGELDGVEHAVDAALAEAAGHQDAVYVFHEAPPALARHAFGLDPVDVDLQLVRQAAMQQGFLEALVGVFVFGILAHQRDGNLAARVIQAFQHGIPAGEIARAGVDLEQAEDDFVHALGGETHRYGIHALDVARRDHRAHVHVAEQGDFLLHLLRDEALAAAQQNIGLDTEGAQFLHAMLGGQGTDA